jgi:uncharacterized protein YaaW (UPF0174 family)
MTHGATFFSAISGAPWDDVVPLARVLDVALSPASATVTLAQSRALWEQLSYIGSNQLAYLLRGLEGVDYPEIVRDVCKHLKLSEPQPGEEERVVEHNEQLVLAKIFADAWDQLDTDERREFLRELNLDEGHSPLAGAGVADAVLAGKAGPFAIYKLSRIVANSVARAVLARRLAPARRKAVQAVVLVASLRQAQRTALAQTALASSEAPAVSAEAGVGLGKPAQRAARKKLPATPRPAAKQKAAKKRTATAPRNAKAGGQREAAGQKTAKKAAKKQTAKKTAKRQTAKKTAKKRAAKKRGRSAAG